MRMKVDQMLIYGYLGIVSLFAGLISLCFFWGIWEYKKPKDSGPLFIDLDRTIKKRMRNHDFRNRKVADGNESSATRYARMMAESKRSSPNSIVNETIRIRGDIRITKGEVVPYNMIVEGNLVSQEDVTFQGGLNVKGWAVIGANNCLKKSVVCQKDLLLCENVTIFNCIDCEGLVFVKNGIRVGVGIEGGGIASTNIVYLEQAEGPLRIHSKEGIRIVGNMDEVIPDSLRQVIEVKTR